MEVGVLTFKGNVDSFRAGQEYNYLASVGEFWLVGGYNEATLNELKALCIQNQHSHPDVFLNYNVHHIKQLNEVHRGYVKFEKIWSQ